MSRMLMFDSRKNERLSCLPNELFIQYHVEYFEYPIIGIQRLNNQKHCHTSFMILFQEMHIENKVFLLFCQLKFIIN